MRGRDLTRRSPNLCLRFGPVPPPGVPRISGSLDDVHHCRAVHQRERPLLRGCVPSGLHLRGGRHAIHPPRRVHRLRCLRTGVPGHRHLPRGRHAAAVEILHREEPRRVPERDPPREAAAQGLVTPRAAGGGPRLALLNRDRRENPPGPAPSPAPPPAPPSAPPPEPPHTPPPAPPPRPPRP